MFLWFKEGYGLLVFREDCVVELWFREEVVGLFYLLARFKAFLFLSMKCTAFSLNRQYISDTVS